jgi:glycosyltransferase involved in cell wall biosynthesis
VSVVVTTYDRPGLLADAIRSLELQTRRPDEVIVVDDGSPRPVTVVSDLPVRVVRQENAGLASARNRGVAESTGDVVFFLDDDDVYLPGRIERALAHHARADLVCCAQGSFEGAEPPDLVEMERRRPRADTGAPVEVPVARVVRRTTPNFGATSIHRDAFVPLDESYRASQDVDWWLRAAEAGRTVLRTVDVDLLVRRHTGARHSNGPRARFDASVRLLGEHAAFFARHPDAKAFRLSRISVMAGQLGRRSDGVRFAVLSLLTRPSRPGVWALWRAAAPARTSPGRRVPTHDPGP